MQAVARGKSVPEGEGERGGGKTPAPLRPGQRHAGEQRNRSPYSHRSSTTRTRRPPLPFPSFPFPAEAGRCADGGAALPLGVGGAAGAAVPPAQRFLPGAGRALPPPAAPLAQRRHLRRLAGGLRALRAVPGTSAPPRPARLFAGPPAEKGGGRRQAGPARRCARVPEGAGRALPERRRANPGCPRVRPSRAVPRWSCAARCGCRALVFSMVFPMERRQGGRRESIGGGSLRSRYRPLLSNLFYTCSSSPYVAAVIPFWQQTRYERPSLLISVPVTHDCLFMTINSLKSSVSFLSICCYGFFTSHGDRALLA